MLAVLTLLTQGNTYTQQGSAYPQQGSAYPQQGNTYAPQNSAYPQTYPQTGYAQNTTQNTAYNSYRAPVTTAPVSSSTASKAQARINPNAATQTTNSDPNKKISF